MEKEVVIYFFGFMFCALNIVSVYFNLNNKKLIFNKKLFFSLIIFSIFSTLINEFNFIYIKSFFSLITLCCILIFCFAEKFKITLIYSILIWILGLLLDLLCMTISSSILQFMSAESILAYSIYLMYGQTILLQLIFNILSRIKIFKKFVRYIYNVIDKIKIGYLYNIYFMIIIVYLSILSLKNLGNNNYVIPIFIIGVTLIIIKINDLILSYQNYTLKQTNQILIDNNKFFVEINSETRKFKHNLIHKLNGIKAYGTKITNELINDIIAECNLLAKTDKEVEKLPAGINGLIYQKLYQKEYNDLKIMISNNIKVDLYEHLKARNYNRFCEVLGVTLDNALEASFQSKEKVLQIWIEEDEDYIIMSVKNTFNYTMDMDKVGEFNYTTKHTGNGIGLFSILFNKEVKTKIRIINNVFETKITVPKLKKERF